jgi:hypothetical protein
MAGAIPDKRKSALSDADWDSLLSRIETQKCTPFLGAEASSGSLPSRSQIAAKWAEEFHYPMEDSHDLARVAQFIATNMDQARPREVLLREFKQAKKPDFQDPNNLHGMLADLPLPIYITTAYDDFMMQALQDRKRDARKEFCRWNRFVRGEKSAFDGDYAPNVANPVVYHLYGHSGILPSMVFTEDDYLDFLVNTSRDKPIPPRIEEAFTNSSLLFLGYRFSDLEFRVLLRTLHSYLGKSMLKGHVTPQVLQVGEGVSTEHLVKAQEYLSKYCIDAPHFIKVFWGTTQDFLAELKDRRTKYGK